ncbi:MAG: imidazoleglycerol-phosphate dehydratase HisB [Candidatus Lokiarchaeota archaeon]|nr:imidazoleglycerol-phosphate dehydratase HisB [Candidatus Lokiarchaeota archaeon]MBD3199555.1 imidazoleglycerol-phosphate dehydratase HisB [Candidatus Lokiarchaeota archaeon]
MDRISHLTRNTKETQISIDIDLDGIGNSEIDTGFKFIDHMLTILAKHSMMDLKVKARGDLTHHIIEDIAIALGKCIHDALGEKIGINRYGFSIIPMDESLARCAIDFSDRKALVIDLELNDCSIEDIAVEDLYHFFNSFSENAKMNLHLHVLYGDDNHHKAEAAFKALAQSIKKAKQVVSEDLPSTKGVL